jgi:hypothetical protein
MENYLGFPCMGLPISTYLPPFKKGMTILKITFEKVFDMIEHLVILQALKQKGVLENGSTR